jgi:ribosomal protein S18 acetylase RimI-like enzyme
VQQMHDAFAESADGSDAIQVAAKPDADWARVFLGPGFDPVDGESRVQSLSRGTGNQFVSARFSGRTVAVGTLSIASGWASVHGLRTESASRGQGWASRILYAMARAALQRGAHDVFLQVEQDNAAALALYRRAGFRDAWRYRYWARTD